MYAWLNKGLVSYSNWSKDLIDWSIWYSYLCHFSVPVHKPRLPELSAWQILIHFKFVSKVPREKFPLISFQGMAASLPVPAFHLEDVHTRVAHKNTLNSFWLARNPFRWGHEWPILFFFFFFEAIFALSLEDIIAAAIISTCFTSRQTVVHVARGVVSVHGSKYFTCWRADKLEWLLGGGGFRPLNTSSFRHSRRHDRIWAWRLYGFLVMRECPVGEGTREVGLAKGREGQCLYSSASTAHMF